MKKSFQAITGQGNSRQRAGRALQICTEPDKLGLCRPADAAGI